jgi:hypothetical protein
MAGCGTREGDEIMFADEEAVIFSHIESVINFQGHLELV